MWRKIITLSSQAERSEDGVDAMVSPILIGCEESQVVCKAFRDAGYEAYSCDLQPTRGNPEWHIQGDIMHVIPTRRWGLIILHPDCTAMALSGNRWYGKGMPRHSERIKSVAWTVNLWELAKKHSKRVVLENPASVIFQYLKARGARIQYVQPHEHGHGETKKTGFALHNVDPLTPTKRVDGREPRIWKMGPSPTRKRDRSETYPGIAKAMVWFWGDREKLRERFKGRKPPKDTPDFDLIPACMD